MSSHGLISSAQHRNTFIGLLPEIVCTVLFLLCVFCPVQGQCAPLVPSPDWIKRTPVADKMLINGIPSRVEYFEAERELEKVLDYYRRTWQGSLAGHAGYREAHVEPWHIISRLEQRHLLTVQVRRRSALNAEGYLAVANLDGIDLEAASIKNIPHMAGTKVLNQHTSFDPGKKGEVALLANKFSVASNSRFYRSYYADRGWGLVQDQELADARVMTFRRFGTEVRLVVKNSDLGSVVTFNRVIAQ